MGGVHAQATWTSVDELGFTLDWTDGNRRQFAYVRSVAATLEVQRILKPGLASRSRVPNQVLPVDRSRPEQTATLPAC